MSFFPTYHLSIYVSNLEASVKFYNQMWRHLAAKVKPGYAKWELEGMVFSIVENPTKIQPQFGHMGIRMNSAEELKQSLEFFKKLELPIREEMGTNCCYALQDKFWISDPDNYQWEFYLLKDDVEFNDPHYNNEKASACCSTEMKVEEPLLRVKAVARPNSTSGSCDPKSGCC